MFSLSVVFNISFQVVKIKIGKSTNHVLKFAKIEQLQQAVWNEELQPFEECFDLLFYALTQFLLAYFLYLLMFVLISHWNVASIGDEVLSLHSAELFYFDWEVLVYKVQYTVFQHPNKVALVCFVYVF